MSDIEMKIEVEADDLAEELSDEALSDEALDRKGTRMSDASCTI